MKEASFYNELTRNKSLLYTIKYEKNHIQEPTGKLFWLDFNTDDDGSNR